MPLVAGVDCSTQSTKVVVVDTDEGLTVASASRPNTVTGAGGRAKAIPWPGSRRWRELCGKQAEARLTGASITTERSDVSGTGWWSPADEDYAEDVLSLAEVELGRESLPVVLEAGEPAGGGLRRGRRLFRTPGRFLQSGRGDRPYGCPPQDRSGSSDLSRAGRAPTTRRPGEKSNVDRGDLHRVAKVHT